MLVRNCSWVGLVVFAAEIDHRSYRTRKDQGKAIPMKIFVMLLVCGLAIAGLAQQSLKTFASPNGVFRFQYPDMLVNCASGQTTDTTEKSARLEREHSLSGSCVTRATICNSSESDGKSLACFAYPKEKFKDKPHFIAAAFSVSEVPSTKTKAECVAGSPNWSVTDSKPHPVTINGASYEVFEIEDDWAGGGQTGSVYRIFHNERCYELAIQVAISRAEYDPAVKEFSKQDRAQVEDGLRQALNSFVFTK